MERLFVDFLRQLHPKPEYLLLFGEVVIDVWKQKQAQATALHEAAQRRLNALRERKQRLIDAFVYQQAIDRATYQEQLHKLNEELAFAEIDERDAWTRWICGLPLISRVRLAKCAAPVDRISVRAEAAIATSPFSTGRANRGWQLSNR